MIIIDGRKRWKDCVRSVATSCACKPSEECVDVNASVADSMKQFRL